jgi:hypothetical protein
MEPAACAWPRPRQYNLGHLFTTGAAAARARARNFLTARDWRSRCTMSGTWPPGDGGTPHAGFAPPSPGRLPLPAPPPPTGSELGSRKPPTTPHKAPARGAERPRALAVPHSARAAARSPGYTVYWW